MANGNKNGNGMTWISRYWPIITAIFTFAMLLGALQVQVRINASATKQNLPICQFVEFQKGLDRQMGTMQSTLDEINRNILMMNRRNSRANEPR